MSFHLIPWSYKAEANNGVLLYELDCELECLVKPFGNGGYELSSIVSVYVYGDGKVADLLNSDAGQEANEIGERIRKRALYDKDVERKAIDAMLEDIPRQKPDHKRMQAAE